jgi:hypothetical protein
MILITITDVIPAKAGIQKDIGFPRIKYGADLVKPGMTNHLGFGLNPMRYAPCALRVTV